MKLRPLISACLLLCVAGLALAHEGPLERLERINHVIEQDPGSPGPYLKRGRLYAEMEHFDEARADFDTAAKLGHPGRVVFDYGVLCYQMGDLPCALTELDRHIESSPGNAAAYEYRSRVHQSMGAEAEALADLKRYFQIGGHPSPGLYLTASQLAENLEKPEEGLLILDEGIDRLGQIPQLQRRAVEMELGLGNSGHAVRRWESCREVLRDSAEWKIEMARLLILDEQLQEAGVFLGEAKKQLAELRPTPARIKSGETIAELERQLRSAR